VALKDDFEAVIKFNASHPRPVSTTLKDFFGTLLLKTSTTKWLTLRWDSEVTWTAWKGKNDDAVPEVGHFFSKSWLSMKPD
jgi:hypothetical protein